MDFCTCPAPDSLTTIVALECGFDIGQIQRLGFQRNGNSFNSEAATPTDITLLSDWQTLTTAVDDTKVVLSPTIGGDPTIEPGEPITNGGGDNSTLNGVEEINGVNPSLFSCNFKSLPSQTEDEFKKLMCERNLTVYFFLQGNRVAVLEITPDEEQRGFDLQALFVSDRRNSGFSTKDTHDCRFNLLSGWSKKLAIYQLAFNPLTEL